MGLILQKGSALHERGYQSSVFLRYSFKWTVTVSIEKIYLYREKLAFQNEKRKRMFTFISRGMCWCVVFFVFWLVFFLFGCGLFLLWGYFFFFPDFKIYLRT